MLHPNEVKLDENKLTLLLLLNKEDIRAQLEGLSSEATIRNLKEKRDFHITVIGFGIGKILQEALAAVSNEEQTYLKEELRELIRETNWDFSLDDQKAYFIQKEYSNFKTPENKELRESIIQTVSLPGLEIFYKHLNELFDATLELPPAHITLFVGGSDPEKSLMGIGIASEKELAELHPVYLPWP